MPIRFDCPACGKMIIAPDSASGLTGPCPFCRATIKAPSCARLPLPEGQAPGRATSAPHCTESVGRAVQAPTRTGPVCHICGGGTIAGVCSCCSRIVCRECATRERKDLVCSPCRTLRDGTTGSNPVAALRAIEALGPDVARHRPQRATREVKKAHGLVEMTIRSLVAEGALDAASALALRAQSARGLWGLPPAYVPSPSRRSAPNRPPTREEFDITAQVVSSFLPVPATHPGLTAMVGELASRASIPTPRLWILRDEVPNACAVGFVPEEAHLMVTAGLLNSGIPERQLFAVLSHEVAHITLGHTAENTALHAKALDIQMSAALTGGAVAGAGGGLGATVASVSALSDDDCVGLLGLVVGLGIAAVGGAVGAGISAQGAAAAKAKLTRGLHHMEFAADARGAELSGDPQALADALAYLDRSQDAGRWSGRAVGHAAHAFIVAPGVAWSLADASTHPPCSRRIAALALLRMAREAR